MYDQIVNQFYRHSNDEKALQMTAYMKNKFPFLGIPKPLRTELDKDFIKTLSQSKCINWDFIDRFWQLSEREFQYLALDYLLKMKESLQKEDIERLQNIITIKPWWDTVDIIASNLVGKICTAFPELIPHSIVKWANADDLWLRRSAILFQLKYKEKTDHDLLAKIILMNQDSQEFFINKANGWALREFSKCNPQWVKNFMEQHSLHPLTVREGSKYCL